MDSIPMFPVFLQSRHGLAYGLFQGAVALARVVGELS